MWRCIDRLRAYLDVHPRSRKVFVIGCGRSGTHWLGYVLDSHPAIHVTVEKPGIFDKVTAMALDASKKRKMLASVVRAYRREHARVVPLHYVDKSHPNLWHVEELAEVFARAKFIGIQRNPYATVSSMLQHEGVAAWCKQWKDFPVPNPFLGITTENAQEYEELSLAGRCAMRWLSHRDRMQYLVSNFGEKIHVVEYERLSRNVHGELDKLQHFLQLEMSLDVPEVKESSLNKWKKYLSENDIHEIQRITGIEPPA